MPKRKDRFVTGFRGPGQCVYGSDDDDGKAQWIEPMPKVEARGRLAEMQAMSSAPHDARIFELVEVKPS